MAPKKQKAASMAVADLVDSTLSPTATINHHELMSPGPKPHGTIYFPITDDTPEATDEANTAEEDDNDEEDDEQDIAKLLEPLSREQLVALLCTAVEANPATMVAMRRVAESEPASRKLIVHGMDWGAGADDLRSVFSRFGKLEDYRVISSSTPLTTTPFRCFPERL